MKEFIKKYYPFALETEKKTGIRAVFTLTQAGLESGWGKSAPGNMFFGVKATKNTPENKRQLLTTTEILPRGAKANFPKIISVEPYGEGKFRYKVKDWFKKYDTPEECFTDHADFFFRNQRYAKALKVKNDPYQFAEEIARAGYATDPAYASKLKKLMQKIEEIIK